MASSRLAVITGGAQGIGRGIVEYLLARGWRVAALDRDGEALAELDAAHPSSPLLPLVADNRHEAEVDAAITRLHDWQGAANQPPGLICWSTMPVLPIPRPGRWSSCRWPTGGAGRIVI
ncbi:SDR family NAD(P)-dependent oxidoreductase [Modicisalibacter luteus]|uniref:SDR family NAD(P)-dependent oxidoreductase n=1 Tax=Modicisalibacter luteus TaxID=453962 RepID=UPI00363E6BDD